MGRKSRGGVGNTCAETADAFKILDLRTKWMDEERTRISVTAVYRLRDGQEDLEVTEVGDDEMTLMFAIQQKLAEDFGTRKSADELSETEVQEG